MPFDITSVSARRVMFAPVVQVRTYEADGELRRQLNKAKPSLHEMLTHIHEDGAVDSPRMEAFDNLVAALKPRRLPGWVQSDETKVDAHQKAVELQQWAASGDAADLKRVAPNYVIELAKCIKHKEHSKPDEARLLTISARSVTDTVLKILRDKIATQWSVRSEQDVRNGMATEAGAFLVFAREKGLCSPDALAFMEAFNIGKPPVTA